MLDAPVWVGGKVIGVLCHEHSGPSRDWSAEEVDFVSALAAMVSLALEESSRAQSEHLRRGRRGTLQQGLSHQPGEHHDLAAERQEDFVEANDAFVRWFGLGRDRILGHDSQELGIWVNLESPYEVSSRS